MTLRTGSISLGLIAQVFFMLGCDKPPLTSSESAVQSDSPIIVQNRWARDDDDDDDGFSLYVSSGETNSVLAYAGETGAFERRATRRGGLIEPEGLAFGPDGNLYVSSRSDEVRRYNGKSGKFIGVFASGHGLLDPAGIVFGGPGNDLYVSSGLTDDGRGNRILRFDGATGAFKAVLDPNNAAGLDDPEALAFGSDGLLYVTSTPVDAPAKSSATTQRPTRS